MMSSYSSNSGQWGCESSSQPPRISMMCELQLKNYSYFEVVDCGKCLAKTKVSSCNTNNIAWVMLQRETDGPSSVDSNCQRCARSYSSEGLLCAPLYQFTVKGEVVIRAKPA